MNKAYSKIYSNHLRKILFNLSIFGVTILCLILLGSVLSAVFYAIAIVIAFAVIVFSFGSIFVAYPEFISNILNFGETLPVIIEKAFGVFPYVFAFTMALSITSLVTICFDKQNRSVGKIVSASIITGLCLILGLIFFIGGIKWEH